MIVNKIKDIKNRYFYINILLIYFYGLYLILYYHNNSINKLNYFTSSRNKECSFLRDELVKH